jgi:putative FmdB family regulatory protein
MPKYKYQCINCLIDTDFTFRIDEEHPENHCEKCGYELSRVYNIGAITFKGDGWASKDDKYEISYNQSDNR